MKWVQVDLGTARAIERVVVHPQTHSENDARGLIPGYGFPLRFRVDLADDPDFKTFTNLGRFNEGVMKATNFKSPKHGAIIHLTQAEADRLANRWGLKTY